MEDACVGGPDEAGGKGVGEDETQATRELAEVPKLNSTDRRTGPGRGRARAPEIS